MVDHDSQVFLHIQSYQAINQEKKNQNPVKFIETFIFQFLNPKETKNGYFIESGWASIGNKIKVPTSKSVWSVIGNKILSSNSPVALEWDNGSGLIFKKQIPS